MKTMTASERAWRPVGVDSYLEMGPTGTPVVAHRGRLELLPLDLLPWADFESLLWRVLRDVEGLRHPHIYGDPGQAQHGLDIIAQHAGGAGVALQSKRVKKFGPAHITGAVDAFRNTQRPFAVHRFILGVSRPVRTTKALNRFKELQPELQPIELELWDQRELSRRLQGSPEIVIDYFGRDIAEIFCEPFELRPRVVPTADATAVRRALARTPEVSTGAAHKSDVARQQAADQPESALKLVEEAQSLLEDAGFTAHASQYEGLRSQLLVAVGRANEATRRRLDQLWFALDQGSITTAMIAEGEIRTLADQVESKVVQEHAAIASIAVNVYNDPLGSAPTMQEIQVGEPVDRARLAALAGETALASNDKDWLKCNSTKLRNLAGKLPVHGPHEPLRIRLRILAAEGSGNWKSLLAEARALKLDYDLGALVQARYARYAALDQRFEEAEASWNEAAGNACLAERWTDAARWTFSRRAFRARWRPFTSDELLPVQLALSARGPDATVLVTDGDAVEHAYQQLARNKLRSAAISAQRALRDAATLSDWEGESSARRVLADVLAKSGEHLMAAHHLLLAGESVMAKGLAADRANQFLNVVPFLSVKPWWIAGAAWALIATQADLVPDEMVAVVADGALAVLDSANLGELVDLSSFGGSRFLGAISGLAGLSRRLSEEQATRALKYFEAQLPVEPNHYRYHDEDEARVVAGVVLTHTRLEDRGLRHLVELLDRSQTARRTETIEAIVQRMRTAGPLLEQLAAKGSRWAREMLDSESPETVPASHVQEARDRLEAPLTHAPGVFTYGSGAHSVHDAQLVRTLPADQQRDALAQLLDRATDPMVTATDRASYLIAASNLRPPSSKSTRNELLTRALALVTNPPTSIADEVDAPFRHVLGAVRMNHRRDTRGEAAFLAATLAKTRTERVSVRSVTLGLVGDNTVSDYWVTRALQRLGDSLAPDVGFLSGQNWALKSLAAILWSDTTNPAPVGPRLAADTDVRVRRALALHLTQAQQASRAIADSSQEHAARVLAREHVLETLRQDPVRS